MGQDLIKYEYHNGDVFYYLEEVRIGREKLSGKTFYKTKGTTVTQVQSSNIEQPLYTRASVESTISQLDKNANDDLQFSRKRIFTGSAASYDKPSLQYIGTGEGAQVFGWGLYGSESEKVARWYAEKDADRKNYASSAVIKYMGTPYTEKELFEYAQSGDADFKMLAHIFSRGGVQNAISELEQQIQRAKQKNWEPDLYEWLKWIQDGKSLYLNKEKVQNLIAQQRINLADVSYLDLNSIYSIVKNFKNAKNNLQFFRKIIFSGSAACYLYQDSSLRFNVFYNSFKQ